MTDSPLRPPPSSLGPGSSVWAYLRDSGGSRQDRSVEQQRQVIEEYCLKHGLILIRPPWQDIHESGKSTTARDAFNEMVATAASEHLRPQGLLIWNFARWARDVDDAQIYKGILRKRGIVIHSLTDPIPEGPYSNVIETLIHVADEGKRREAALGAWRGLRHLVRQGAMPGNPPRGFVKKPITVISEQGVERQAHRWVPDPEWIPAVRTAFELRSAGRPLHEINQRTGLYGSLNSYRTFFDNKLYMGVLEYGSLVIDDYCDPIVSRELWEKVQKVQHRFARRGHVQAGSVDHPRRQDSVFILSGMAKCARCGSPLYGHTAKQPKGRPDLRAYRCTRATRRRDCDLPRIPAPEFEQAVIDYLQETFLNPDYFAQLMNGWKTQQAGVLEAHNQKRRDLERDLRKVRRSISNVTEAISDAGKSPALLKRLRRDEDEELQFLQKLSALKAPQQFPDLPSAQLVKRVKTISERLRNASPSDQRQILPSFLEDVIIDRIGNHIYARINIYLPPGFFTPDPPASPSSSDPDGLPPITVPTSKASMGAPQYTHSYSFDLTLSRKPRNDKGSPRPWFTPKNKKRPA